MASVEIDGACLDVVDQPGDDTLPPVVFLHHGLGSVEQWGGFPDAVRTFAGAPRTVVYSRRGYGRSTPRPGPWPVAYMHAEALEALPALLGRLDIDRPVLVGHSDGGSIALIHAGAGHPVAGLALLAPHVFVEDRSVRGIEAAADAFRHTELRRRLGRYHADVDATFGGWSGAWLSGPFRDWNIEAFLPAISAPVLVVQGDGDEYGTLAQVDAIVRGVRGPVDRLIVTGAGHEPQRDAPDLVTARVGAFVSDLR